MLTAQVFVSGIVSIVAGIVILVFPQVINYLIGIGLIIIGIIVIAFTA